MQFSRGESMTEGEERFPAAGRLPGIRFVGRLTAQPSGLIKAARKVSCPAIMPVSQKTTAATTMQTTR